MRHASNRLYRRPDQELEAKLARAEIIDVTTLNPGVRSFSRHGGVEMESGESVTYQIVGEDEANIKEGLISITSPIARALIGKRKATSRRCRRRVALKSSKFARLNIFNLFLFRIFPIKRDDMADRLNQFGAQFCTDLGGHLAPFFAIGGVYRTLINS